VDMRLEVVVLPVADVDRAKNFYGQQLGWRLDADFPFDNGFRVVQFTPPGSGGSIQFGTNMTSAAPGSAQGLYLIVSDIQNARDDLAAHGAEVSEVFHAGTPGAQFQPGGTSGRVSGPAPDDASYGDARPANYEAVPRVTYTDPQAAAVGAVEAQYTATAPVSEVPKTATYTHAYAESNGFLTLLSDGQRLTGAYALGPEAGEWMQQATLAIRAHVPIEVLSDTIQPFPSFSGIYDAALEALRMQIADMPPSARPMAAQTASLSR
jgi:predicted enzyme related to lactoylglutathione lyase